MEELSPNVLETVYQNLLERPYSTEKEVREIACYYPNHLKAEKKWLVRISTRRRYMNHPVDTRYIYYPPVFSVKKKWFGYKAVHYAVETSELYKWTGFTINRLEVDLEGVPTKLSRLAFGNHAWICGRYWAILLELSFRNTWKHPFFVSDAIHELQELIWYDCFSVTIYPGPDCSFLISLIPAPFVSYWRLK